MSMTRIGSSYEAVRGSMRVGDMIAFSGKGTFSEIIKTVTRSGVSHVAAVMDVKQGGNEAEGDIRVQLIESTSLNGFLGVSISFLSQRLQNYHGEAWWFPLSDESREILDVDAYCSWLMKQHKKPYDFPQAVQSGLDRLGDWGGLMHAKEDFERLFCSELMAGAHEAGKVIGNINASEVTPRDMTRFNLWYPYYYQILGEERELKGCGMTTPEWFGI